MKFLIVEDDKDLNDILNDYIQDSFKESVINQVYDGETALELFYENTYDLVLLDVMLPGINGFDVCKEIRESYATPIIMLSALTDEENQIKGYDLGIDEFVKKPYSPKLVIKKIEAVLQRYDKSNISGLKSYGLINYDLSKQKFYLEDQEVKLNNKEWELFNLFIHNKGIVMSRDTILNKVWGYEYYGDERTVDTHIKRLRQKMGVTSSYIKTIYKTGYKFEK
jgi:two-component system response regulator VanR